MRYSIAVLKFGSSVLRSEDDLPQVVNEIYRWLRECNRVIAVVSAIGGTTDHLFTRAATYGATLSSNAIAELVATGEATSAALLGLALDRAGIPSVSLDAARLELATAGPMLDATPESLNTQTILTALSRYPVAIIPGFVGRTEDGCTSLLGRGGSDLTALFIAHQVQAVLCRLVKDVDGLYECDPATADCVPRRFRTISWQEALELSGEIVQHKAVHFAQQHQLSFEIAALNSPNATLVGAQSAAFFSFDPPPAALSVGLLGLGTVGGGVYQTVCSSSEFFDLTGVAVRDLGRPERAQLRELLSSDPWSIVQSDADVIVELIGGEEPARSLILAALRSGKHVVTANKLVVARHGKELRQVAQEFGVSLRYSAAVGGAVPMLEIAGQVAKTNSLQRLTGVLNGTCNFVLDQIAQGCSFAEAVAQAQALGFAEADPTLDLDGTDTAQKLALLAQHAFDAQLDLDEIEREGILRIDAAQIRDLHATGKALRLMAELVDTTCGLQARVRPEIVDGTHPFAQIAAEQNSLICETVDGAQLVACGKGAGRWPTTVAVMADLLALSRDLRAHSETRSLAASRGVA